MNIEFPPLEIWQDEVFQDIRHSRYEIYVVKARRQCGKSILAIFTLLYYALNRNSVGVVIEPTLNQSRRVFKQLLNAVGGEESPLIKSANASLLSIEFSNGSEIMFKSAEQGEALRGMTVRNSILVIDEAAFIPQEIFETLYPVVDANRCPIMMISTPLFKNGEYYLKYEEGTRPNSVVKSYNWSDYDTSKYLSPEKLEYYRASMTPLKFQSEYLGLFIEEGSYIFGDFSHCVKDYSTDKPYAMGIDWGTGTDNDYTVLTMMDREARVTKIIAMKNQEPTLQIERIARVINENPTLRTIQVETNSIGEVYYDMLKRKVTKNIKRFTTTNNTKRAIIENLITAFSQERITIPNETELITELQHYAMEKTAKGYTYNGADGVHDDYVMSLAFAYDALKGDGFKISFV